MMNFEKIILKNTKSNLSSSILSFQQNVEQ